MLRTRSLNSSAINPVTISEDSTIEGVGNRKIDGAKVDAQTAKSISENKSKRKN